MSTTKIATMENGSVGTGRRLTSAALPLLGAVVAVGGWWLATIAFGIRPFFLPAPPDIVDSVRAHPDYLAKQTWVTCSETLMGFGLATVAGLAVSMLLASSRIVERAVLPLFVALNSVPKVALAPLLVVWLGFGPQPKILMVVLICFFPILISTMAGLTSTPGDLAELARSLSASWWQTFVKVRIRWAMPQMFVGLKVAISLAVIGAVVAELANPNSGLGAVIVLSGSSADTPLAFAAITLLALLSIVLFYVIALAERLLLPWARQIAG